jgi:hypothetical protein
VPCVERTYKQKEYAHMAIWRWYRVEKETRNKEKEAKSYEIQTEVDDGSKRRNPETKPDVRCIILEDFAARS